MRISEWAKKLGVDVSPFDSLASPPAGATVYRVADIWTTRDGSWDVSNKRGSITQWARDDYLERKFDDAGADHHIFGRVLGDPLARIRFWTWNDNGNLVVQPVKMHSEWGNIVMWSSSSFVPERGERGPWAWRPDVDYADVVSGGGLPANEHVSWFAVWRAETYDGAIVTPPDPVEPPVDPGDGNVVSPEVVQQVNRNRDDIERIMKRLSQFDGEL